MLMAERQDSGGETNVQMRGCERKDQRRNERERERASEREGDREKREEVTE